MTLLKETLTDAERAECNAPGRRTITGFTRYSQAIPSTELSKVCGKISRKLLSIN